MTDPAGRDPAPPDPKGPLTWRVRGAEVHPEKLRVLYLFAVIAAVFGWAVTRKWFFAPLGFGLVLASTAEFWLGVTFFIDDDGVSRRVGLSRSTIAWADIRRVVHQGDEIHFSPLERSGRADAFRGVKITVPADLEERVRAALGVRLNRPSGKG